MKNGGELYISVPDFTSICFEYLENRDISSVIGLVLGGQKNEEDLHGMIFDFESLTTQLHQLGFSKVERYEWSQFDPFLQPGYDDYSAAHLPHMDFENGRLMMLNIRATK